MGHMKNIAIQQANGDRASRSDGAGSLFVVLDAHTKRVMTGALVMFPGQDEDALRALTAYANDTHDSALSGWAAELAEQWAYTKEGKSWGGQ